ncbi:MAG: hypothetical protein NTX79_00685 [Candidatus Micrarchaeota archaeon]|nr:hypothetical protein [Candidatus Micrarchaeota archaeon]
MALKLVDGKEVRVPGRAIPDGQRRPGIYDKLDRMSFRKFQRLPLCERAALLDKAREIKVIGTSISFKQIGLSKGDIKEMIKAARPDLVEKAVDTVSRSISVNLTQEQKEQACVAFIDIVITLIRSIHYTKCNIKYSRHDSPDRIGDGIVLVPLMGLIIGGFIGLVTDAGSARSFLYALIGGAIPIIGCVIECECRTLSYMLDLKRDWLQVAQQMRDAIVNTVKVNAAKSDSSSASEPLTPPRTSYSGGFDSII